MSVGQDVGGAGADIAVPVRPGRRQAAFGFIFATSVMNALSFGLMIPVLPLLLKSFVAGDTAVAALWQTVFALTWGAMQFFAGPVLGLASDRFGRRPILLISLFGLAADFMIMALAPNLGWLFLGRVLNGLTASSGSTGNAYLVDVTPPEDRARRFGMLGSAFSFGFLLGPILGGYLAGFSLRLPFVVAAGLALANALYGVFILPESLPRERRVEAFALRRANPLASLGFLRAHGGLGRFASMNFLLQLQQNVWPMVYVLYVSHRYHWTSAVTGLVMMISGVAGIGVQMGLVGPVVRRIGERGAVVLGVSFGAIGMTIYGWAPTSLIYFVGLPFNVLAGFAIPGLMALMTNRVGMAEQGQLQGANQALVGIASIVGPLVYGPIFAWALTTEAALHAPGAPFYVAALAYAGVLLLSFGVRRRPALQPA
ncbi:MAG TPA: TCR/Tet family MFS transporter [Caulobacteraceae bacterium]|nr:TCR/Tet family MFS transporter [Caulobacteraceae bacterium]